MNQQDTLLIFHFFSFLFSSSHIRHNHMFSNLNSLSAFSWSDCMFKHFICPLEPEYFLWSKSLWKIHSNICNIFMISTGAFFQSNPLNLFIRSYLFQSTQYKILLNQTLKCSFSFISTSTISFREGTSNIKYSIDFH